MTPVSLPPDVKILVPVSEDCLDLQRMLSG